MEYVDGSMCGVKKGGSMCGVRKGEWRQFLIRCDDLHGTQSKKLQINVASLPVLVSAMAEVSFPVHFGTPCRSCEALSEARKKKGCVNTAN